ncbi:hypothetical protein EV702DRAFT_1049529 [Suillus placidus]|uniref:Uncharacterized protein n=1 Tax=Suillus placidus TaxID=48579 RepID=A0A9P6ZL19_9AGAM|nr:hypothetical protein EV702DRAFT_1049529 [Suillus placidus]
MTPPHTHFNVLFRNHLTYHSRSLKCDHTQRSSLETVPEDGPDSLDRPRNTSVDGFNQGLQPSDEPEVVDCTLSDKCRNPAKLGTLRLEHRDILAEARISQRQADTSDTQPSSNMPYPSPNDPTTPYAPCPSTPLLPTFTPSETIPTTAATSTSSADSTPQPSNLCDTSVDGTSSCPTVSRRPPSGSYSMPKSTGSCADCLTLSSASRDTPSGNVAVATSYDTAYTTVASTYQILATTTTLLQPLSSTVTSASTVMVSSPLPQPSSVSDTTSNPQLPPTIGAIVGGTVGAVVLLALLIFIVLRRRRKQQLSVTPFNLLSTTGPTLIESRVGLKFQNATGAIRPSSRSSSFIQYSDGCLADNSGNRSPSCATGHISSHFADDEISASSVARRYRSHELEKLYPYPSHVPASNQYRHHSVESWVEHMDTDGCSQEPSEELPAYPRSVKSLRSREADHDNRYVLTSS